VREAPSAIHAPDQTMADPAPEPPRDTAVVSEPVPPAASAAATSLVAPPMPVAMAAELAVVCAERAPPSYPVESRQRGETGLVVVRVEIDERGWVAAARVERSSGHAALDDAALRAVQAWRCTPPTRHGLPARGVAMQPFNFSLGR
jgi:protein TonB